MFNLDILETIGKFCDPKTKLSLSMTDREYYEQCSEVFSEYEYSYMYRKIKPLLDNIERGHGISTRLRRLHKMMRETMKFPHVIKRRPKLHSVLNGRLDIWNTEGMSASKTREYKRFLASV